MQQSNYPSVLEQFNKLSLEDQIKFKNILDASAGQMKGKVVLITGGNRGIGKTVVEIFAKNGASIVFCSSTYNEKAKALENEIQKTYGIDCIYCVCDQRNEKEIDDMVNVAVEKFGKIDILINNAGKSLIKPLIYTTLEEFNECISINLTGVFLFCKKVAPIMIKNKWGRIVNISSGTTQNPQQALSAYMAAKNGVISITKGLALEVGKDGITVNTVFPGCTDTDMLNEGIHVMASATNISLEDAKKGFLEGNAIPLVVPPGDVADTIYFLCREEAKSITGSNCFVDCGFSI
jgi:NAD(P)-dependent dehydrogenase (short-subunit alcohol dehydrogenase family)